MNIERNENPFDNNKNDNSENNIPQESSGKGIMLQKKHIAFAAAGFVFILCISILLSFILYNTYLKKLYPLPINQNYYDIEYSFTDEPLIAVADKTAKFVVAVSAGTSAGSGVIIKLDSDRRPYILTNWHVIKDVINQEAKIMIKLFGSASFSNTGMVNILGYDEYNDIAVLKFGYSLSSAYADKSIDLPSYITVQNDTVNINYNFESGIREEDKKKHSEDMLVMGKRVMAIGNALGQGLSACDGIISNPLTSIKTRDDNAFYNKVIQVTAPINPGNSGGALFDMKGQLIGINTYKARTMPNSAGLTQYVDNISYTVPVEIALSSAYRIIKHGADTSPSKSSVMTLYNIGLDLKYESDIVGAQETSVLTLAKISQPNIAAGWNQWPENSGIDNNGKRTGYITEAAGISFSGFDFASLSLKEKEMLLLKLDCELYKYKVGGVGAMFTIKQGGVTCSASNIRKV